jgi:hypothetical protein
MLRAWWALPGLLALLCTAALAQDQPKRFLEVSSQGYSRYEISEGDVVAFFTGGVQCSYLGYTLVADELRYNHATQVATASGKVSLTSPALSLDCESVVLDGTSGELRVDSDLRGALAESGLGFSAGSAVVHFPPGQMTTSLKELSLELTGAGDAGVTVTGPNSSELKTAKLEFEGQSRTARSPGPFTLTADLSGVTQPADQTGKQQLDVRHVTVTGASLAGVLDESGMLSTASITDALLDAGEAKLQAAALELQLSKPEAAGDDGWTVEASGNPISGNAERNGQAIAFTAQRVSVISTAAEVSQIELRDKVSVTASSGVMTAELVRINKQGRGFSITAPDGLRVSFDLAALSGNTPVDLPDLGKFSKQE